MASRVEGHRLRDYLVSVVVRPLIFAFWAFVAWGTFVLAVALWHLALEGPGGLWRSIRPVAGLGALESWVNLASAALAVAVWIAIAVALGQSRRPVNARGSPPSRFS
jgi:hypothetical protein